MVEDMQSARKLLNDALDRYITACSAIGTTNGPSYTHKSISEELSDDVHKELDLIASKLTCAQVMVNRAMNNIPTHTPIHMLPSDTLSYIFQLVRDAQPGYLQEDLAPFDLPYPETLTHVCSLWRRIAIGSRTLWSYIQISDSECTYSNHARLLARAKVFAARADPSPVDIRIIPGSHSCYDVNLNKFCASVAPRIRSFDLAAESFEGRRLSVLRDWLSNCKAGPLNKLVLKRKTSHSTFERIEASESPTSSNSLLLEMPHEYLEERLRPIGVLRLTGIYFHWTSQAYHGLVELGLFPINGGENLSITHPQLKAILAASPRLRELHFGLQITDIPPPADLGGAVSLEDLEVVNLCSMKGVHYGPLLQLLAPGTKPLQLSLNSRLTSSQSFPPNEAIAFFSRSNVAKLHIESFHTEDTSTNKYQPLVLLELLSYLPALQALSLRCFYLGQPGGQPQSHEPSSHVGTELKSHPTSQLALVHLRDCTIDLDYLRRAVQTVPIQKLKYKGCWFYSMADGCFDEFKESEPRENFPSTFNYVSGSWSLDESDPWA